jgi:hypothetical protein
MKKRIFMFLSIVSAVFFITGCGGIKPPLKEITNAKLAITEARALGAEDHAPLYFLMANEKLENAEKAVKEGKNEEALEFALKAKADADLSAALSQKKIAKDKAINALEKAKGAEEREKKVK